MKHFLVFLLLFIGIGSVTAQNARITGTVKDNTGEAVIGANIKVKDSTGGTITDIDGHFNIEASSNATLVVSFIGYITQEVPLKGRTNVVVTLSEDSQTLDEVVVVGYGTQKKVNLTGSVAAVKVDEKIASRSITNVSSSLSGLVPGLVVSQTTGFAGGDGASLKVRGLGSINNSDPLIVVDGMPDVDINRINMNDIESISVLKDAASSAVYGSRAANGVILITTKGGSKEAKSKVTYNGSYALSSPVEFYDYLADYSRALTMQMRSAATGNKSTSFQQGTVEQWMAMGLVDPILFPNTDQYDEMFRTGAIMNHTVSASGGNDKINFYTSLGIMDQEGLQIHNDYSRYNMRLNVDYKVRDNVKIGIRTDGSWSERQTPRGAGLETAGLKYVISGILNKHPETGEYGGAMAYGESASAGNAVAEYEAYRTNTSRKEFNGNAYLEWEPLKDLKLNVSYALRYYNQFSKSIQNVVNQMNFQTNSIARTMPDTGDIISNSNNEGHKTLFQGRITYEKEIFKGHHISAMFNAAEEYWFQRNMGAGRKNRLHNSLEELDAASKEVQTNDGKSESEGLRSFIGRVNYTLFDKYLFEFNFRSDGSSKFRGDNRFGYFPSGSLAWGFMEEDFMKPLKSVVSSGKLRASWGLTGNNRVGEYDTYALYQILKDKVGDFISIGSLPSGVYPFENSLTSVGTVPTSLRNRKLKWETTEQWNLGLDLGFLDERIGLTVDWYRKTTRDLLLNTALPTSSGYFSAMKNVGKVRNQGIEFTLNTTNIKNRHFSWTTNFNIAFNKNKVLELAENQSSLLSAAKFDQNYNSQYSYIAKVGYPMGMMYGFIYEGTYKYEDFDKVGDTYTLKRNVPYFSSESNTQPGMPKYADLNGDGIIDDNDRTMIGNGMPKHTGGFTNNFEYKGFDLSIFFQWSYGNDVLNANRLFFENSNKTRDLNQYASYADRWTPENPESNIPRATDSGSNKVFSTRIIEDGSFLRLKTVSLGYTLPKQLTKKWKIDNARVFVAGQNLWTCTGYSGYDPEVSIREGALTPGLDFSAYPRAYSISFGINLGF